MAHSRGELLARRARRNNNARIARNRAKSTEAEFKRKIERLRKLCR